MPAVARIATPKAATKTAQAKSVATTATHAVVGKATPKSTPKAKSSTNCGSGAGGFKPGNICGGAKRAAHAANLRTARAAVKAGKADAGEVRKAGLALKAHRRGTAGKDLSRDQLKEVVGKHKAVIGKHSGFKPAPKVMVGKAAPKAGEAAKVAPKPESKSDPVEVKAKTDQKSDPNPATHTDHEPGHVGYLSTSLIHADPARFQFKEGSDAKTGSVNSLDGAEAYDQNLGGILQVWKDPADHKTYVVNGHNRLAKAQEKGADKVTVRFLDASNAREARSIGALTNIAEGNGTPLDAATFFRDTGLGLADIKARGLALKKRTAVDGVALAGLSDHVFENVRRGKLSQERGAIIGGAGLSHAQQDGVLKIAEDATKKSRKGAITDNHLKEIVDHARAAPVVKNKQKSLFGDEEEDLSLGLHRTKVAAVVKDKLSKNKRLFKLVSKSKNASELTKGGNTINTEQSGKISQEAAETLDIFDRLKGVSGPVSAHLNRAARRIHDGERADKVYSDTYKAITADMRDIVERGGAFAN